MIVPFAIVMAALVAALLVARKRSSTRGTWIFKPLCAACFLALAASRLAEGEQSSMFPIEGAYDVSIAAGLLLGAIGDVLLIPTDRPRWFLAGLGSFLLGHVAYVIALFSLGFDSRALLALVVLLPALVAIDRWLRPHVPSDMLGAVRAYMVVITSMMIAATSAALHAHAYVALAGATLFYLSDLAVARDRFVTPGFANEAIGLPLYFGAQLFIAATI